MLSRSLSDPRCMLALALDRLHPRCSCLLRFLILGQLGTRHAPLRISAHGRTLDGNDCGRSHNSFIVPFSNAATQPEANSIAVPIALLLGYPTHTQPLRGSTATGQRTPFCRSLKSELRGASPSRCVRTRFLAGPVEAKDSPVSSLCEGNSRLQKQRANRPRSTRFQAR